MFYSFWDCDYLQWLMPSEGGYLEAEGIEKTWRIKQESIAREVDISSSKKQYDIVLPGGCQLSGLLDLFFSLLYFFLFFSFFSLCFFLFLFQYILLIIKMENLIVALPLYYQQYCINFLQLIANLFEIAHKLFRVIAI